MKVEAATSIKGFSMINGNHSEVIKQLQEDYGNQESLIDVHLQRLDNLPMVKKPTDVSSPKQLYRHVVSNIKSLDAMGSLNIRKFVGKKDSHQPTGRNIENGPKIRQVNHQILIIF